MAKEAGMMKGGMHGSRVCMAGACMEGGRMAGVLAWKEVSWQGACMAGGYACRRDGH